MRYRRAGGCRCGSFLTAPYGLDRLQEYRQALIAAAVTGQLDIEAAASARIPVHA